MNNRAVDLRSDNDKENNVYRYLDVSTGNITQNDSELLANCKSVIVVNREYGHFVHVRELYDTKFTEMVNEGFSESFIKVIVKAMMLDCSWILFDADAELHQDLDKYDW